MLNIIYEDRDLIVLNKPSGTIVNSATSHSQLSLQSQLQAYLGLPDNPLTKPTTADSTPAEVFAERLGMVHRLDKDTSGVLLWAKNPLSLDHLLAQFRTRQVSKTYHCLTHGLLKEPSGRIFLPLARKSTNRQIMAVAAAGRPALTNYQVERTYQHFNLDQLFTHQAATLEQLHLKRRDISQLYQGFSFLTVTPQTGRTHQIRAHLTHLGHPLVGDLAYLPRRKAKLDPLWCPHQFLHAAAITFIHPTSGETLTFTAPLPQDLQQSLTYLT